VAVSAEFSFATYERLLDAAADAGYAFLTVRDYLATDADARPERFVVLRHDVDRKPANAAKMARIEAERSVPATYYFRTSTFEAERLRRVEALGHEVGYHYEDYVRAGGVLSAAHESFSAALDRFRSVADVETVCMHGNPLSPHDNRDMWTDPDAPSFDAYDLLGEAYLSMDFEEVTYFSDTGRTWLDGPLKIKDHTMGQGSKAVTAETTTDLVDLLGAAELRRACLLVHPNRWADSLPELVAERSKDRAVNLVKRGMRLLPTTP
jgi:hypothetical protein